MGNYRLTRRGKFVLAIFIILVLFLIYFVLSALYEKKNSIEDSLLEPSEIEVIVKDTVTEEPDDFILHNNNEPEYSVDELEILKNKKITVYFLPDCPDLIKGENLKINDFPIFKEQIVIEGNINGYPDFHDTEFGIWLGNERAERIKAYLIGMGFSKDRIQIINNGSKEPVNKNGTPSELQKNRRVEVYYKYDK